MAKSNPPPLPSIADDLADDILVASMKRQGRLLSNLRLSMEEHTLVGGQRITCHREATCWGYWCPVHNPSPHHMVKWEQVFNETTKTMHRVCSHGTAHPDPDEPVTDYGAHSRTGCCGCCNRRNFIKRGKQ